MGEKEENLPVLCTANKNLPSQLAARRTEPERKTRGRRPQMLWFPINHSEPAGEAGNSGDWGLSVYTSTAAGRGRQAGPA